ncbi:MAG TPA: hypothetical protein PKO45_03905 [Rubrivivax sp.]|nr:hypothetical protein [Rubrivivax sp.]
MKRAASLLVAVLALLAPTAGATPPRTVDLGATVTDVQTHLGAPLRAWSLAMCPDHRLELRRRGQRWLKLVYDPEGRLWAAAVFQLARASSASRPALRWPGLRPGFGAQAAYPSPQGWRPLLMSLGAKQWLWMEVSENDGDGRTRVLGGVVVNDASDFAAGRDFPHDVAETLTAIGTQSKSSDWADAVMARPLLRWRRRTPPNAYIEALDHPADDEGCNTLSLALPDYTDFTATGP